MAGIQAECCFAILESRGVITHGLVECSSEIEHLQVGFERYRSSFIPSTDIPIKVKSILSFLDSMKLPYNIAFKGMERAAILPLRQGLITIAMGKHRIRIIPMNQSRLGTFNDSSKAI
nr:hypothetical protein Iba_chr12fCG17810 [Ipomoea batatas]